MSKYSDKKKKQQELRQQGVDVYALYHPTVPEKSEITPSEPVNPANRYLKNIPMSDLNDELMQQYIDQTFHNGPNQFFVCHTVNGEKVVFRINGCNPEDVMDKIRPLKLMNAYVITPSNFKFTLNQDKLPEKIRGIPDTKFQEMIIDELYRSNSSGEIDFVAIYKDSDNVTRCGTIRANSSEEVFKKFKLFGIRPCKVYQQCFKGE